MPDRGLLSLSNNKIIIQINEEEDEDEEERRTYKQI